MRATECLLTPGASGLTAQRLGVRGCTSWLGGFGVAKAVAASSMYSSGPVLCIAAW